MNRTLQFLAFAVLGTAIFASGCASRQTQHQIDALQAQVGVIADELAYLDQGLQDVRGSIQSLDTRLGDVTSPSGFAKSPAGYLLSVSEGRRR